MTSLLKFCWGLLVRVYALALLILVVIFFFNYGGAWLREIARRFPLK